MPIEKVIPNARALRFVNSRTKHMNKNGTIKEDSEYVKRSPKGSARFYFSLSERYKKAQAEDADNPEVWLVYSPEEIAFGPSNSEFRKKYRVEDRQFRPEFLDKLDPYLMNHELTLQQQFYRDYQNIAEGCKLAETVWGYNYSKREYEDRWGKTEVITDREQLLKDIRNGEDIDSLPEDVDLDEYTNIHRRY
ncbi:MAG: hypothetical protein AAF378_00190 [Cyanobacteria bacterium P01_A01_bin.84]